MPTTKTLISSNVEDYDATSATFLKNVGIAYAAEWTVEGNEEPGHTIELVSYVEGIRVGVFIYEPIYFALIGPWEGRPNGTWQIALEGKVIDTVALDVAFPEGFRRVRLLDPKELGWDYFDGESKWQITCLQRPSEGFKLLWSS